jgi:ActR/RegA family two-component response regulator
MSTPCPTLLILSPRIQFAEELSAKLVTKGIEVHLGANDRESLRAAAAELPCAVIIDLRLEAGWSFDLISEVRAQFRQAAIFLTSDVLSLNNWANRELAVHGFYDSTNAIDEMVTQISDHCQQVHGVSKAQ